MKRSNAILLLLMLLCLIAISSCGRIREKRIEKEIERQHLMELKYRYYNRFFFFVDMNVFFDIKKEVESVEDIVDDIEYDLRIISNQLEGVMNVLSSESYLSSDEIEEIKNEIEEVDWKQRTDISYSIEQITGTINAIKDYLESVSQDGFSGEDIVKFMPYAEG